MIEKASSNGKFTEKLSKIQNEVSDGLLFNHTRINFNTTKTLESTSFLYALIELLSEKGMISIDELDKRKKEVAERQVKKFAETGIGLMYQTPEFDKYNFKKEACIDCQSRLDVCKANCCKFPFALSRQDIEERIVRWEFGKPYLIAHDTDGYCVHLNRENYKCTVHEHRPVPCRGFDCKDNKKWKVWQDYDQKILNPELEHKVKKGNEEIYSSEKTRQMRQDKSI